MKQPAIYIITNKYYGTLYTGVTANLLRRVCQHRYEISKGFSNRYGCNKLVYYELLHDMPSAIAREKQIKGGSRMKKIKLIESINPKWEDLYPLLCR